MTNARHLGSIAAFLPAPDFWLPSPVFYLLSAIGLYISLYFALVYYGVLPANTRLVPAFCRMEEQACRSVLDSPYAKTFALPNSLYGAFYYLVILAAFSSGLVAEVPALLSTLKLVAWFAVGFGVYLTYALFFKLRVLCPLCLASHAINLLLALLFSYA